MDIQIAESSEDETRTNNLNIHKDSLILWGESENAESQLQNYNVAITLLTLKIMKLNSFNTQKVCVKKSYSRKYKKLKNIHNERFKKQNIRDELIIIKKLHLINLRSLQIMQRLYERNSDLQKLIEKSYHVVIEQKQQLEKIKSEKENLQKVYFQAGINFFFDNLNKISNEIMFNTYSKTGYNGNNLFHQCYSENKSFENLQNDFRFSSKALSVIPNSNGEFDYANKVVKIIDTFKNMFQRYDFNDTYELPAMQNIHINSSEPLISIIEDEVIPVASTFNNMAEISRKNGSSILLPENSICAKILQNFNRLFWPQLLVTTEAEETLEPLKMPILEIIQILPKFLIIPNKNVYPLSITYEKDKQTFLIGIDAELNKFSSINHNLCNLSEENAFKNLEYCIFKKPSKKKKRFYYNLRTKMHTELVRSNKCSEYTRSPNTLDSFYVDEEKNINIEVEKYSAALFEKASKVDDRNFIKKSKINVNKKTSGPSSNTSKDIKKPANSSLKTSTRSHHAFKESLQNPKEVIQCCKKVRLPNSDRITINLDESRQRNKKLAIKDLQKNGKNIKKPEKTIKSNRISKVSTSMHKDFKKSLQNLKEATQCCKYVPQRNSDVISITLNNSKERRKKIAITDFSLQKKVKDIKKPEKIIKSNVNNNSKGRISTSLHHDFKKSPQMANRQYSDPISIALEKYKQMNKKLAINDFPLQKKIKNLKKFEKIIKSNADSISKDSTSEHRHFEKSLQNLKEAIKCCKEVPQSSSDLISVTLDQSKPRNKKLAINNFPWQKKVATEPQQNYVNTYMSEKYQYINMPDMSNFYQILLQNKMPQGISYKYKTSNKSNAQTLLVSNPQNITKRRPGY